MLGVHFVARILRKERKFLVGVSLGWFLLGVGRGFVDCHARPLDLLRRFRRLDLLRNCLERSIISQ